MSIIAALIQITQFVAFIIGDKCDPINAFLETFLDGVLDTPKCFEVVAELRDGCWILFAAGALSILVGQVIHRTCERCLDDRLGAAKKLKRMGTESLTDDEFLKVGGSSFRFLCLFQSCRQY